MSSRETSKVFKIDGKDYKFVLPTLEQATEADMEYSKTYGKALQNGILPKVVLERQLKKVGAWTDEQDAEIEAIEDESNAVVKLLVTEEDKEKKKELAVRFMSLRNTLGDLASVKYSMFLNSAEAKAQEAKLSSVIWKCVFNADGSLVWPNRQALNEDNDTNFVGQIGQVFMSFLGRLEENLEQMDDLLLGDSEDEDSDKGDEEKAKVEVSQDASPAIEAK